MAVVGRPSVFSESVGDSICELIREGISMRKACEALGTPLRTFQGWLVQHEELAVKCARARESSALALESKMQEILASVESGELSPDQARVMLSSLQWIASKRNKKDFGDKLQLDSDSKLQIEVTYAAAPALPQASEHVLDAEIVADSGDLE